MSQYGTTILVEGQAPIEADIVFVHGLGGDSTDTWSKDGKMWPRDLLKERVPHARIMTWGYDADPVRFLKQTGHQTILSHALDLLADLNLEREEDEEKTRPIIFVGHSLGGLVVKQALIKAAEYVGQSGRRYSRQAMIGTYCSGIVFLGTPHRGADLATWATTATRLAKAIGKAGNEDIVSSLKSGSPTLESLQDSFAGIQGRFNIHTVLEAQSMHGIGKVVEDYHAQLGCENEQCIHISADHKDMCKFTDKRDTGYRRVAGAIREQVEDANLTLEQRANQPALNPQAVGRGTDSSRSRQPSPGVAPGARDTPSPYPANVSYPRQAARPDAFQMGNMVDSLSPNDIRAQARKKGAPPLPPRKNSLITQPMYKRLFQELIAIEGPCPPEKYQWYINIGKQRKTWTDSTETFKRVLVPDSFDPDSAKSKNELLYLASYVGDIDVVRKALEAGADAEYSLPILGDCPLNAAMTFDHSDIIELLLSAGASFTSMTNAHSTGEQDYLLDRLYTLSAETLRILLTHRGKDALPSYSVLMAAAESQPGVLQVLQEYNFDFYMKLTGGQTALHIAVMNGQAENVTFLINSGFPVDVIDDLNQTPLYAAIRRCDIEMVTLLLNNGASVNIVDVNRNTPVHTLVSNPRDANGVPLNSDTLVDTKVDILELLLNKGTTLEVANSAGQKPLHLAIAHALGVMAAALLIGGADGEARNSDGYTPLHLCAAGVGEQYLIAALLIQRGASLKARLLPPNPALTPLDLARRVANAQMVNLYSGAQRERGLGKWLARHGVAQR